MDDFTRYKKLASRQVTEIRKLIAERDDCLEATAGSAGRQSVMLSAQIREQLKAVKDTHGRMQSSLHQEEKDRNKGGKPLLEANSDVIEEHSRIVELTQKHIEECEALEKRRFQTGGARGGGGRHGLVMGGSAMGGRGGAAGSSGAGGAAGTHPMKDIQRNIEVTDLDPIDEDSDVGQGLAQVSHHRQHVFQLDVCDSVQRIRVDVSVRLCACGGVADSCGSLPESRAPAGVCPNGTCTPLAEE
jgi:ElaB/YqjD/DUF883 family membrane-anchored ribosome-binding protein